MDRAGRLKKASLVKKALDAMREEVKTASQSRKADLYQDMTRAQTDYDALTDVDSYPDEYFDDTVFDDSFDIGDPGDDMPPSPMDDIEIQPTVSGVDAPPPQPQADMEMEGCSTPMSGEDMWASTNLDHVSYVLDKIADLTAAVEKYEHRAATSGKTASTKGARNVIANVMKKLAMVVHKADFTTPEAGKQLDAVGTEVMALHKRFGLPA